MGGWNANGGKLNCVCDLTMRRLWHNNAEVEGREGEKGWRKPIGIGCWCWCRRPKRKKHQLFVSVDKVSDQLFHFFFASLQPVVLLPFSIHLEWYLSSATPYAYLCSVVPVRRSMMGWNCFSHCLSIYLSIASLLHTLIGFSLPCSHTNSNQLNQRGTIIPGSNHP